MSQLRDLKQKFFFKVWQHAVGTVAVNSTVPTVALPATVIFQSIAAVWKVAGTADQQNAQF